MQASIASILDSLRRADLEDAKRKIQALMPDVKTERERGSLMAAAGIYASMSKAKGGTMQTWDSGRVERAARSISGNQLADDFDAGFADTLVNYSKLTAAGQQPAS
ncbi:MAG: hypothetical protein JRM80_07825 [Nitrososphaerota archaeon]|nr:hypothetical protein [Nitrososphaerota archaeon]